MNPITGEKIIKIAGVKYTLRFTWRALSEIEARFGDAPNLFKVETAAAVAAAGLRDKHPDMTEEKIMELSPPLMPLVADVQQALQWAYFGAEAIPGDKATTDEKKNLKTGGLWRRIAQPFRRAFHRASFGISHRT